MENQAGAAEQVKALLRRACPGAYSALLQWRNGPTIKALAGAPSRRRLRRILKSGVPFQFDIYARMGLGATLTNLLILHHCFDAEPGLKKIIATNPLYTRDVQPQDDSQTQPQDILDFFLDRLTPAADAPSNPPVETVRFGHACDVSTGSLTHGLTIHRAHRLFNTHYAVKPQFLLEARAALGADPGAVLGVHFRGSDKRTEAPRIAWDRYAQAAEHALTNSPAQSIFVATDEAQFLDYMLHRYGAARIRALDCRYLADGLVPPHFQPGNGYEKGREAFVTMLALSLCASCIRGPSNLSAFSKILNPALAIVMLGEPYPPFPFPEAEILSQSPAMVLLR